MIINGQSLLEAAPIAGMAVGKHRLHGVSWGLTECGYDIRIKEDVTLFLGRRFVLASSIEEFDMPDNLMGRVLNKSTWARRGLDASKTTNIEPGWKGFLTIELTYSKCFPLTIKAGSGICQVIFEEVRHPARYAGKYQNQPNRPIPAILDS
jgi:dCTP deaminase